MGKTENQIIQFLNDDTSLTLYEIAEKLDKKPKTVFKSLRKLFQQGKIVCDPRTKQYMLAKEEEE
jgi:DNA-binding IclR family transcriptional regulator